MNQPFAYIVSSDEPLLMMERCDEIIEQAKAAGIGQREIVEGSESTEWDGVANDAASMSLFAEAKMLDIRFDKMPGRKAQSALVELFESASPDLWLLLRLPRLDKRQQSTKWFQSISSHAHWQVLWPPRPEQMLRWLEERARARQLQLTQDALHLLAELTEGNLLAADQSLEKLSLLKLTGEISSEQLAQAAGDNARYNLFHCVETAARGDAAKAVKMLNRLRQEGIAPIVIFSAILRDIEAGLQLSVAQSRGESWTPVFKSLRIWESKQGLYRQLVSRLPLAAWERLLVRAAQTDKIIKGQATGDVWLELETALRTLAGQPMGTARQVINRKQTIPQA